MTMKAKTVAAAPANARSLTEGSGSNTYKIATHANAAFKRSAQSQPSVRMQGLT